jgi:hypothetical protein
MWATDSKTVVSFNWGQVSASFLSSRCITSSRYITKTYIDSTNSKVLHHPQIPITPLQRMRLTTKPLQFGQLYIPPFDKAIVKSA